MEFLEELVGTLNGLEQGKSVSISGKLVVRKIPWHDAGEDDSPNRLFEYESFFDIKKTGEKSYEISDVKGVFAMSLDGSSGWRFLKDGDYMCVMAKSMQCQKPEECQKVIDEKKPDQVMIYPA